MLYIVYRIFPYGNEIFAQNELDFIAQNHKNITLINFVKSNKKRLYIPNNIQVLDICDNINLVQVFIKSALQMFSKKTFDELFFMKKDLKYKFHVKGILRIFLYYFTANKFLAYFKKKKLTSDDIFYSYWLNERAYALYELKKYHKDIKIISRGHGYDIYVEREYSPFRKEILSNFNQIHIVSCAGKKSLVDNFQHYLKDKIQNIYVSRLGIIKIYNSYNYNKKDNHLTILSCSHISQVKRIDIIIDAICNTDNISIKWIHFGKDDRNGKMQDYIKQKSANKPQISYEFKGVLSNKAIQQFYSQNKIDIFLNTSDSEGIPVSIMEAFSYNIPVIARDVGGNCEIVNNDNGILLKTESDYRDVSKAIESIYYMDNKAYLEKRENAFNTFNDKYNAKTNYNKFAMMIKEN